MLELNDFYDDDYELIAINGVIDDYKLTYRLNVKLNLQLRIETPDITYQLNDSTGTKHTASFTLFSFEDQNEMIDWYLIHNKFKIKSIQQKSLGLFDTSITFDSSYVYLQPEVKTADYILKYVGAISCREVKEVVKEINRIEGVVTAYKIDQNKLNNKEYLIF